MSDYLCPICNREIPPFFGGFEKMKAQGRCWNCGADVNIISQYGRCPNCGVQLDTGNSPKTQQPSITQPPFSQPPITQPPQYNQQPPPQFSTQPTLQFCPHCGKRIR